MGECMSLTREVPDQSALGTAKVAPTDGAEEGEENLGLTEKEGAEVVKHKVKPLKNYQAIELAKLKKPGQNQVERLEDMDAETMLKKRKIIPVLKTTKIFDDYIIGKVQGIGNLGEVRRCQHRVTLHQRCVKLYSKRLCKSSDIKRIFYEIELLCTIDHPSIIKVIEYYEDADRIYMVTELCTGGDL